MSEYWRLVSTRRLPRIHLLSDIHLETGPYAIPAGLEFDILVAAGDIGPVEQAVEWLASIGKPVVYVLGNHEYWGREFSEILPLAKAAARNTKVHVLERGSTVIQGVRFLGATLWTDYGSWHPDLVHEALRRMRDYHHITASQWFGAKSNRAWFQRYCKQVGMPPEAIQHAISKAQFHPAIAYQQHLKTVSWLKKALARRFDGPTVVVTHHAPTYDSLRAHGVHESLLVPDGWNRRDDELVRVAAYASRLDALVKRHKDAIDIWVHGHLHTGFDVLSQGMRVTCNPRGYAQKPLDEKQAKAFELLGYPVSVGDIERSQALHREQPFRGDASYFDASLVIDLEAGLQRPISRAIETPLMALRERVRDVRELTQHLLRMRGPVRKFLIRGFGHELHTFNDILDELMARIRPALATYAESMLAEPPRPWPPIHDDDYHRAFYDRTLEDMEAWCEWVKELPMLTQVRLTEWARRSHAILALLEESGIDARIERLPVNGLRLLDSLNHRVVANISEELCVEWRPRLDKAFGGTIPRKYFISLQSLSDFPEEKRKSLLTRKMFIGAITRAKEGAMKGFKLRSTQDSKELLVKYQSDAALLERKEIITAEELRASLGISEKALSEAIRAGVVFSIDVKGITYFPAFFADPELDWKRLARVAKPLHGLSGWHKWFFFTSPKGSLGDLTPLEALKRGMKDDVLTAAYGFAER